MWTRIDTRNVCVVKAWIISKLCQYGAHFAVYDLWFVVFRLGRNKSIQFWSPRTMPWRIFWALMWMVTEWYVRVCMFIAGGPGKKLCAGGGRKKGGHVTWDTTSRSMCERV